MKTINGLFIRLQLIKSKIMEYCISSIRHLGVNQQIVCCVPGINTSRGVILKEVPDGVKIILKSATLTALQ